MRIGLYTMQTNPMKNDTSMSYLESILPNDLTELKNLSAT